MTDDTASTTTPRQIQPRPQPRRRASRAAGPANGAAPTRAVVAAGPRTVTVTPSRPVGPAPRRRPHRSLVALVSLATILVAVLALGIGVGYMVDKQRDAEAAQARDQRFVDTASQLVVNMFSYTQDTIDTSVDRFVNSTSGPLRDMMSNNNNVENLKALFRETSSSSEAVVNGAALEGFDSVSDNASVLVSVRVTVSDQDGNNKPSQPYRMRVVVHEDENGQMTTYDLKYPDGGN